MRILVTNDDGIDSEGLCVLARRLTELGEVVIVAPDKEYSGFSAALGPLHLLQPEVQERAVAGVSEAFAINGAPALCVYFARLGVFGDFDIVVSGINPGVNTGRAIYHSGTVGAATTARIGGINAVAVSQSVDGFGVEGQGWDEMIQNQQWDTAAEVAAVVTSELLADLPDPAVVVNINVPNRPASEIERWRYAEIGTIPPRSISRAWLEPKPGHEGAFHVGMEWGDPVELPIETDGGAVEAGEIAISVLTPFQHASDHGLAGIDRALEALTAKVSVG